VDLGQTKCQKFPNRTLSLLLPSPLWRTVYSIVQGTGTLIFTVCMSHTPESVLLSVLAIMHSVVTPRGL
jgi:hypothetical protein